MKRYFYALLLLPALVAGFSNCGGDDDDNDGGGSSSGSGKASTTVGVLEGDKTFRLTKVGEIRYFYTERNQLDYVTFGGYVGMQFSYSPNKMVGAITYRERSDEEASVSYNGKGYITKVNGAYTDESNAQISFVLNVSYDGAGHVTKITTTDKETGRDDGDRYTETTDETYTFTWKNNQLQKLVYVYDEKSTIDGNYKSTSTWTFGYDNNSSSNYANIHHQYAPFLADAVTGGIMTCSMVGLFGVGPDYLPSGVYMEEVDSEGDKDTESRSFSYEFNENGSIKWAKYYPYTMDFSYEQVGTRASGMNAIPTPQWQTSEQEIKGFMSKRLHRHLHRSWKE